MQSSSRETESVGPVPRSWIYANDGRIVSRFLGGAMLLFGAGMLLIFLWGAGAAEAAVFLLAMGAFFLTFTLLLFVPRLRSNGAISYSLVVDAPVDVAASLLREVLEVSGKRVEVRLRRSQLSPPTPAVLVEGSSLRFLLRTASQREGHGPITLRTEIVQTGLRDEEDATARDLREQIAAAFASSSGLRR